MIYFLIELWNSLVYIIVDSHITAAFKKGASKWKRVTFIGTCANEIIQRNNFCFFLTKGKSEVMLE
jgi:hypothetical protein